MKLINRFQNDKWQWRTNKWSITSPGVIKNINEDKVITVDTDDLTVQLEAEGTDQANQQWVKEVQDDVDGWFTLYNAETETYLTAPTTAESGTIIPEVKVESKFKMSTKSK